MRPSRSAAVGRRDGDSRWYELARELGTSSTFEPMTPPAARVPDVHVACGPAGRVAGARRSLAALGVTVLLLAACAPTADEPADDTPDPGPAPEAPAPAEDDPPPDEGSDDQPPQEPAIDLDVALTLTDVASMSSPIAGAVGPDGTLYLAERAGTVHPLTDQGVGDPVLDLTSRTTTDGERGLLGLAFAPDGDELHVSLTDEDGDTLVLAYPFAGGTVDDEPRTVYALEQPYANHNGGHIAFGPDGMLYLGLGDGGGGGDPLDAGQDLSTPLGSLLRLDPRGEASAPPDNPFVDREGVAPEIYAYGLRNPWRFSFDEQAGHLWIADVGQDSMEEINRLDIDEAPGANLGWARMEGTLGFSGEEPDDHVPPVHEYRRAEGRCSITGGEVYRGAAIPALTGVYLYTDLCDSTVRGLLVDAAGQVVRDAPLSVAGERVVSFARDADGELYLLDFAGAVRRIDPA